MRIKDDYLNVYIDCEIESFFCETRIERSVEVCL